MATGTYALLSTNTDIHSTNLTSNVSYSNAIKTSIKNIVVLNKLDILNYNPLKGIGLKKYVGQPLDELTSYNIASHIKRTLTADEPRINNITVQIESNSEYNGLIIQIYYIERLMGITQKLVLNYEL